MAQTQILETDKQVTVDQAIENYKRELDATGEDLTEAVRLQRAFSVYIDTLEKGSIDFNKALRAYVSSLWSHHAADSNSTKEAYWPASAAAPKIN